MKRSTIQAYECKPQQLPHRRAGEIGGKEGQAQLDHILWQMRECKLLAWQGGKWTLHEDHWGPMQVRPGNETAQ